MRSSATEPVVGGLTSELLADGVPNRIRTCVPALKERSPGPLDDGDRPFYQSLQASACRPICEEDAEIAQVLAGRAGEDGCVPRSEPWGRIKRGECAERGVAFESR